MITVGIDTSTPAGGVSLYSSDTGLLGEVRLVVKRSHSEQVIKSIDFILTATDTSLNDVDFFTVAIGPGSFTGLRVGLSTAKGFAYATGAPLVAVSTLEAFAFSFPASAKLICPLLDARRGEVYGALFRRNGRGVKRVLKESALDIRSLLESVDGDTLFAGSGAAAYKSVITETLGERAHFPCDNLMHPIPSSLCIAGLLKAEDGDFSDPLSLSPRYLRRSEAEIKGGRKKR